MSDAHDGEARRAFRQAADIVADYLERVEQFPVFPLLKPGDVRAKLAPTPPAAGEPLAALLDDYRRIIEPNVTHWNHPGFLAYFPTSATPPGIAGEILAAGLNAQAMLWRTGPAPTELDEHVCDWLRGMVGLPPAFRGHINDTASTSSMLALAAARDRAVPDVRERGLAGRNLPPLVVYASEHAHSSIDKAAITLGLGLASVRRISADQSFAMRPDALEAAIAADAAAGRTPIAVVATIGTTSSTSVDPVATIAGIARRHALWLHVDAAYAGPAAICPELRGHFRGWEEADSIVVNPHKWLFTPMDCSVLLLRDPDALKAAFRLTPEYLRTPEAGVTNLSEYGPQLGRRFRSLKLWFVIRAYGVSGLRDRIRAHCALAKEFERWADATPGWTVAAAVPFSTVCFRAVPPLAPNAPEAQDAFNERVLAAANAAGPVFLSHTRLNGRMVLRVSIANARTERRHVEQAWELLQRAASVVSGELGGAITTGAAGR